MPLSDGLAANRIGPSSAMTFPNLSLSPIEKKNGAVGFSMNVDGR
jgi:hypothetical protein